MIAALGYAALVSLVAGAIARATARLSVQRATFEFYGQAGRWLTAIGCVSLVGVVILLVLMELIA